MERESVEVETEYGAISVKVSRLRGGVTTCTPEYEECREAAARAGVALRAVEEAARAAFRQQGGGR